MTRVLFHLLSLTQTLSLCFSRLQPVVHGGLQVALNQTQGQTAEGGGEKRWKPLMAGKRANLNSDEYYSAHSVGMCRLFWQRQTAPLSFTHESQDYCTESIKGTWMYNNHTYTLSYSNTSKAMRLNGQIALLMQCPFRMGCFAVVMLQTSELLLVISPSQTVLQYIVIFI